MLSSENEELKDQVEGDPEEEEEQPFRGIL